MMYLLLRNNKQSGPYSLDELKNMGLKPYDLVWVDGKSAAWRYPSEVPELSSFAPAVEEQPFDRFYKKTAPAKTAVSSASVSTPVEHPSTEPATVPGRRFIYVTMPAGKGPAVLRESVPSGEPARSSVTPVVVPARPVEHHRPIDIQFVDVPVNDHRTEITEDHRPYTPKTDEKMSQSTQDWKNIVELAPPVRKQSRSRILQSVAVVVCILALLTAGIFIGLSINKDSILRQKIASRDALQNNGQPDRTSQPLPVAATTAAVPVGTSAVPPTTDSLQTPAAATVSEKPLTDAAAGKAQPPRQITPKERSAAGNSHNMVVPVTKNKDSAAAASLAVPVIHRETVHRTDLPADKSDNVDKEVIKNNIANLVSVGTNGYTVGTFGGISDLQLTVSNRSVYPLDLVVVEVQYIQANKKTFKTEDLYFRGIGPGSALMQEAPKSARGIKVQYKIILVNSKEPGLSYSGI